MNTDLEVFEFQCSMAELPTIRAFNRAHTISAFYPAKETDYAIFGDKSYWWAYAELDTGMIHAVKKAEWQEWE